MGKIDQWPTVSEMVQPAVSVIKELSAEIFLNLSTAENQKEENEKLADILIQIVKLRLTPRARKAIKRSFK
jgi:hypothetical protein